MLIPPISGSNQYTVPTFGQREPQTSPATNAAPITTAQQPAASNSSGHVLDTYSLSQINLAMLLSSQGATIIPPEFQWGFEPNAPRTSTVTAGSQGDAPGNSPTTSLQEAQQIMDSFGSNGVLTLANVESAENGCTTAPAADLINSNTDADIASDFTQLSGGASTMNLTQLTSAIQQYENPQNQPRNNYGKEVMPGATSAISTTNGVPNSPSATANSRARTLAQQYLWQEQTIANTSNPQVTAGKPSV